MLNDKKDMKDSCKESLGGRWRMGTVTVMIAPTPPYNHDLTASHITFNSARYGADVYEDEHYLRVLEMDGRLVLVDVAWNGDVEAPKLSVEAYGARIGEADAPAIERMVGWLLGAHQDLEPFYRIALADDRLAPLVRRFHGLHVPQAASVFEAIIMAILGQQVSSAVARVMRNALVEAYGARMEHRCQSYRAFPSPERLAGASIEELRRLKLSGRKAEYVLDIAEGVTSGELDLEALHARSDAEIVEELCRIRGVGPWTAHWLLIRAFDRADGFPHGDLALQRHVTAVLQDGTEADAGYRMTGEEALEASRRWAPYRSYVTTYLFAAGRRQGVALHP